MSRKQIHFLVALAGTLMTAGHVPGWPLLLGSNLAFLMIEMRDEQKERA